ncbi:hypothetical protein [Streptosporangium subroseum]|uniref:hypothetical protein n=1 Tax=Streptosporangium subroseum TaxID=106412 RepID=UPI003089CCFA|nr:hypothetical protein OHB15_49560 [Streptosporangium subroseum]
MNNLDYIRSLVEKTIAAFDEPDTSVSSLLRRCTRIATLRNDFANLAWLEMEASDANFSDKERRHANRIEYAAHFDKAEWDKIWLVAGEAYIKRRQIRDEKDRVRGGSVEELENLMLVMEGQAADLVVPEGLAPVDLYFRSQEYTNQRAKLTTYASDLRDILSRIKDQLYRFLLETERQIQYGQVNAEIFERTQRYVDDSLRAIDSSVLDMFHSAYRRVEDGDPESLSHALTSCRRIIKAVADALYPARSEPVIGEDGVSRKLDDSKYVNRLIHFVSENLGKHGSGEVLQTTLDQLGRRLRSLDGLASKGVHDSVSSQEVDTCVIQTYLTIGDILRIRDEKSALSTPNRDSLLQDPSA